MQYTVKAVANTGTVDPKYGTKYLVQFNEYQGDVSVSRKDAINVGDVFNGEVKVNSYGAYFKKDPTPVSMEIADKAKSYKPGKQASDGQRQGMCLNNAANYVSQHGTKIMTPDEWADTVHSYAEALYNKGDLEIKPVSNQLKDVQEFFPEAE